MSCNTCGSKFNFFHKELGCTNCGLSFCSKCLKQKCKIPNKGNNEQHVCKLCYTKFAAGGSSSNNAKNPPPPPDAYLKRLENLENPSIPPITIYQKNSKLDQLRAGLSATDLQILERLQKLKDGNKTALSTPQPPPSDSEIRNRLATLKGENPYVEAPTTGKQLHSIDTRNDQQKVDSLLEQFINERGIELANNPQEEIEARLASLREQGVRPNEGTYISNLHDVSSSSEEDIDKITTKIMAEVAIDKKCEKHIEPSQENIDDEGNSENCESPEDEEMFTDELPWCILCNKDGYYRCLDCSNDIYCIECCNQVHQEFQQTNHNIIRFKPKLNNK